MTTLEFLEEIQRMLQKIVTTMKKRKIDEKSIYKEALEEMTREINVGIIVQYDFVYLHGKKCETGKVIEIKLSTIYGTNPTVLVDNGKEVQLVSLENCIQVKEVKA